MSNARCAMRDRAATNRFHKIVKFAKLFVSLRSNIINMVVEFGEDYLKELYVHGESSDKKHRYMLDVIKRYKRAVDYLKWASRKEDLFRLNSLNSEAL